MKIFIPALLLLVPLSVTRTEVHPATSPRPKNIILLIGDGMGLSQISAGYYYNGQQLNLASFPVTGLVTTHSHSHLITDSAAGGTAIACGCKTTNGTVGMDARKKDCASVLELAEGRGMATGIVASSSVTHATPASFVAHVPSRSEMDAIAKFYLDTDVDLVIGGGMKYFRERSDNRNLYDELLKKGYIVSNFQEARLRDISPDPQKPFAWFGAREEPESVARGRDWLPYAATIAPPFLKSRSDRGFFMMLEGSQIDWACHNNDGPGAVQEMIDFDMAIGKILEFARTDGETLVIVTADHETGGLALEQGTGPDTLSLGFNTGGHTASLVPVFAFGPGAENFGGFMDNTEIFSKMKFLLGL